VLAGLLKFLRCDVRIKKKSHQTNKTYLTLFIRKTIVLNT